MRGRGEDKELVGVGESSVEGCIECYALALRFTLFRDCCCFFQQLHLLLTLLFASLRLFGLFRLQHCSDSLLGGRAPMACGVLCAAVVPRSLHEHGALFHDVPVSSLQAPPERPWPAQQLGVPAQTTTTTTRRFSIWSPLSSNLSIIVRMLHLPLVPAPLLCACALVLAECDTIKSSTSTTNG